MTGSNADPNEEPPLDRTMPAQRQDPAGPPPLPPGVPVIPGITLNYEIARGGMGIVYSGRQDFLDRRVAVKLLSRDLAGEKFAARFRREAKILAGIKHAHIVACHSAGTTDDGQSYLVMEFVDGPNLKTWVREHGAVPIAAALRLTKALGQALSHAHQLGVIHRDVKPENILLENITSTAIDVAFPFTPKLVDLGLARMTSEVVGLGLTSPGSVMGTPATMSPEQFDDPDSVDYRTDIYGLGCVLYEMLVGSAAYRGSKMTEIVVKKRRPLGPNPCDENASIPLDVGRLVTTMLAADREQRPKTYRELDERLDALLAKVVSQPAPAATVPPPATGKTGKTTKTGAPKTTPPKTKAPTAKPDDGAAENDGPGLLRTAELDFLQQGMEAGPRTTFREGMEPIVEIHEPSRRGLVIGAIAAVVLVGAGVAWFATRGKTETRVSTARPAGNQVPTVELELPEQVQIQKYVQFTADAIDPDKDQLTYAWTSPEIVFKTPTRATTEARVDDGLPGEVFTAECAVSDGFDVPVVVSRQFEVAEAGFLTSPLFLGFTSNPKWAYDPPEPESGLPAWNWIERDSLLSCRSPRAVHTITLPMGDEAFWKIEGNLEPSLAAVDEQKDTAEYGEVVVRVEAGTTGWSLHCRRSGESGREWIVELHLCELESGAWRSELDAGHRQMKWLQDDDAKDDQYAAISIVRRRDKLSFRYGRLGDTDVEELDVTLAPNARPKLSFVANGGRAVWHRFTLW